MKLRLTCALSHLERTIMVQSLLTIDLPSFDYHGIIHSGTLADESSHEHKE